MAANGILATTMTDAEELAIEIARFTRNPLGFVMFAYPWGEPGWLETERERDWQIEVLRTIGEHLESPNWNQPLNVAVASGHGIGKSALIAQICNWAMSTCDDCRVMVTANTEGQLETKTWPEIEKWFQSAINRSWWDIAKTSIKARAKGHEETWRVDRTTWSENNTEAFQGLHNKGKRIVVIYDEASAIPDKIWEVTEGALTDEDTEIVWIAFGNPTLNTGRFRHCFGRLKHRWVTRQIDSRTVPGTNKSQIAKWVEDFGEDSDFVRVRVRGVFPRGGARQFISGDVVYEAMRRECIGEGWKILAVDVARFGDNQTVAGLRHGKTAKVLMKARGMDTMETARRTALLVMQEGPRACIVDGDGIGGAVVDKLREMMPKLHQKAHKDDSPFMKWCFANPNFQVQEFHGGHKPGDVNMYYNKRAEVWGKMRTWLADAGIPNDPELESDLTGPEYDTDNPKNVIQLERKEDMAARGLSSPDIGDMLAMTFAAHPPQETRQEKLRAEMSAMRDPMELFLAKMKETSRRESLKTQRGYWDD